MTTDLLFDLGGVIMDIDSSYAVKAFKALGMPDAEAFFDPYRQRGLFLQLEEGALTPEEFHERVRPMFTTPPTDNEIDRGLFEFLRGIPGERLERLAALRSAGHRVFMLSNTNAIMWHGYILPELRKLGGDVSDYFDGIVTSFEVGCCKPDARIFDYAARTLGLVPSQTTFFDDGAVNVEGARKCGFNAVHVTADNDFMKLTRI